MIKFVLVGFLGAILGSFAGAQIWRLRARQLMEDKKVGEKVDQKELKKLSPLIASDGWIVRRVYGFLAWVIDGYLASRVAGLMVGKFGAAGDFICL